ncbi:MAG: prolipoprotein diacylglyceryl transferase [Ferrimicrobium sp.]
MQPIPVSFHIGPLQLHTYGFGLGITFWFAYWYMNRRFHRLGLGTKWLERSFIPIIIGAVIGARIVHVVANIGYYVPHPILVFAIWQGGLSSYGGIAGGGLAALYFLHKINPEVSFAKAFDAAAPVLLASWSLGRLLGPQLMYAGGGRPTSAWYGMRYAGEVGPRIPVPIFQSIEDFACFLIVLWLVPRFSRRAMPAGILAVAAYGIWSIERFFDEYLWLAVPRVWDAVEVFALISLATCTVVVAIAAFRRRKSSSGNGVDRPINIAQSTTK